MSHVRQAARQSCEWTAQPCEYLHEKRRKRIGGKRDCRWWKVETDGPIFLWLRPDDGDPAAIFDRALTLLVAQLERTKTGAAARPPDSADEY